jgi:outer membrane protein OmpA-like peptidoglycan-associated protein
VSSIGQGSLLEGERGHRRGVVLGLTLAEIMLLLLFCLLLAAAGLLQDREQQLSAAQEQGAHAQRRAELAEAALADNGTKIPAIASAGPSQANLEVQLQEAQAALNEQSAELQMLRELQENVQAAFPNIRPNPAEDDWRELVLAEEAGRAVLGTGASLAEALEAIDAQQAAENATPSPAGDDWPPMIMLDSDEFRFVRNSAELSEDFRVRLQTDIVDELANLLLEYNADVVEVVGHTDEQGITATRESNLDELALGAMSGIYPVSDLIPADNAGLGLARAISVAEALTNALSAQGVKIIPLSAAQLVKPGDLISDGLNPTDDADRRRIEIRVRRSETAIEVP